MRLSRRMCRITGQLSTPFPPNDKYNTGEIGFRKLKCFPKRGSLASSCGVPLIRDRVSVTDVALLPAN